MDTFGRRSPNSFNKGTPPRAMPPALPSTSSDRAQAMSRPNPGFGDRQGTPGRERGAGNFDAYLRKIDRWTDRLEGDDFAWQPNLGFADRAVTDARLADPLANLLRLLGR